MSDASDLYVPKWSPPLDKGVAVIKVSDKKTQKKRAALIQVPSHLQGAVQRLMSKDERLINKDAQRDNKWDEVAGDGDSNADAIDPLTAIMKDRLKCQPLVVGAAANSMQAPRASSMPSRPSRITRRSQLDAPAGDNG